MGVLLRRLHRLPPPPVDLPAYRPLASLRAVVATAACLSADDRAWLVHAADSLLAYYGTLEFGLGSGHLGNLLFDTIGGRWLLGDWDETATGPRELDLANTYQGIRMGRTTAELDRFAQAYGHDLRDWPGLATLRGLRDLHSLGAFIRRADHGDDQAAAVLRHRLHLLRNGDTTTPWPTP
ncbi:phosphotransferase family protein [Saccharothrix obliqua]|uniref:phosphotransferase family protein n=1 Tax=Saccharothrix obliqua TaxID=2861747 RepID=UPI001C5FF7F3|nr:phosphotransferase [Saccharothrix obliqua]MBW4718688.1 aminoglycoside phosphotransferase family protein [Saccharothrix obliqua]